MDTDTNEASAASPEPAGPASALSLTYSADFTYIDLALKARWAPLCRLLQDVEAFVLAAILQCPYDVAAHMNSKLPRSFFWEFVDSRPIERFAGHGTA